MEISPRRFGDILNDGMGMLARVWRRLFAPTFWSFVPIGALTLVAFAATGADDVIQRILADPTAIDRMSEAELFDTTVILFQGASIAVSLQLLAAGFLNLTAHRIVASEIAGESMTTGPAVSVSLSRVPFLVVAGLIGLVGVISGLVLFVLPGIWLAVSLSMVSAVIAVEGTGPIGALRRSYHLVRGRWWPTLGYLALVGLLGSVAAQLVQVVALPLLAMGGAGIGAGLGFVALVIVQGLVVAAIAVMTTLWYVDLRARNETLLRSSLSLSPQTEKGAS